MPDTLFLLLFTIFSNVRFLNFLFVKYICVKVIDILTNEIVSCFNNPIKLLFTCYC